MQTTLRNNYITAALRNEFKFLNPSSQIKHKY